MHWQRCCEEKRPSYQMLCKSYTPHSGKHFQGSPTSLYIDYQIFLKSESKETALLTFEKYSQFPDTLVRFSREGETRELYFRLCKKFIWNAISIGALLITLNSLSGKRQKMEFLLNSEVQMRLQTFLIRGTDNMRFKTKGKKWKLEKISQLQTL